MRIYSLSKILALPFAVTFALVLYWTFEKNDVMLSYWMIPPFICIAIIYIFHPQIDFWWHKRNPPPIDRSIIDWLETYSPYYKKLEVPVKIKFLKRLSIYLHGRDFFSERPKRRERSGGYQSDCRSFVYHDDIGHRRFPSWRL